jgi:hypothetical protein
VLSTKRTAEVIPERLAVAEERKSGSGSPEVILGDVRGVPLQDLLLICIFTHVLQVYQYAIQVNSFNSQMIQFQSVLFFIIKNMIYIYFRYFLKMLYIFSSKPFYSDFICQPRSTDSCSSYILSNPKFNPFFKNAIGAMDGSHFISSGTAEEQAIACDHKGLVTQNCLVACDFDHNFTYISSGWEGSVSDSTMYFDFRTTDLKVQLGKYYLADAGFPLASALLIAYRGVQYHLAEWGCADLQYVTKFYYQFFLLIHIY